MQAKTFPLILSRSQMGRLYELTKGEAWSAGREDDWIESDFWDEIAIQILDILTAEE